VTSAFLSTVEILTLEDKFVSEETEERTNSRNGSQSIDLHRKGKESVGGHTEEILIQTPLPLFYG
jgi:hypothetical protein